MKKLLLTTTMMAIVALGLTLTAPSTASAKETIGVVQVPLVIKACKAGIKARAAMEEEINSRKKVLESQDKQLKKLKTKIDKEKDDIKKRTLQGEFNKTAKNLKRNWDDFNVELKQIDQRLTQLLLKDIRVVTQQVGQTKGLSMVLEYSPTIMYMDNTVDITEAVTKQYDENLKKASKKKKKKKK